MSFHDQSQYNLRFEWGREGLEALASTVDVIVIVDVLSFTTTVEIGVTQGATLYPYRMRDNTAADYAREKDAVLAVARGQEDDKHPYSLSPQSMTKAKSGARIVLPSPNGATLSTVAARYDATVLAGCLRNASAVAGACRSCGERIAVIAAGERWQGDRGDLRPAIEDLIGAGAILNAIDEKSVSPEAAVAIAAYLAVADDLPTTLRECSSGRELIQVGFAADIKLAAAVDVSTTVPILREHAFVRL
jgi:2-phosphosulfolactate phosphatase